jgi:DNA processing protein
MLKMNRRSQGWPKELISIDAPPEQLWLRGKAQLLEPRARVAIVGSRSPTPYGEAQARRFGAAFGKAGLVVVSGMARGVDSQAHQGALDAGGGTIAVLGCGVDRPWPAGPLGDRIADEGLLISEFPPGQGPRKHHFPLRNRLISALADVVVVIEAAHASGSLITAHWAADQGKRVCALPGRVDHPMARGCHRLIREGAELIESPADVLADFTAPKLPFNEPAAHIVDPIEAALLGETLTSDELADRLKLDAHTLLPRLAELEIGERIVRAPGGLWRLAVEGL